MTTQADPAGTGSAPAAPPVFNHDGSLTSVGSTDESYLEQLGYKQELRRGIGLVSSFGIQFSGIAIASGTYTALSVGLLFFGPASFWSWVVGAAFQVFFVGLAINELVSAYPIAGGIYQINGRILANRKRRRASRSWLAWQSGWWIAVAHTVSAAGVATAMAPFVAAWFGQNDLNNFGIMGWTLGILAVASTFNFLGVKVAARFNNLGVAAELIAAVMLICGLLFIPHQTQPLTVLFNTAGTVVNGNWLVPLLFAFLLPVYTISGFDCTGNAAEETQDAARKAPLGAFLANAAAWVFGAVMILLLFLAIPNVDAVMKSPLPGRTILEGALGSTFTDIFQATSIVALLACCTVLQLTGARVLWAQARDGQMPAASWLRRVSKNQIPVNTTLVSLVVSVIVIVLAAFSPTALAVLAGLASLAWALGYGVTVSTGLWARVKGYLPHRPFSLGRFGYVVFAVAVLWSALICIVLVVQNPLQVGLGMAGTVIVGSVIYLLIPKADRRLPEEGPTPGIQETSITI